MECLQRAGALFQKDLSIIVCLAPRTRKNYSKADKYRHEKLGLKVINSHALVYTWRGSDSSLQPILLTGHQDVTSSFSELSKYTNLNRSCPLLKIL